MLPNVSMECRAVADPELRFAPSGTAVAKVRVVSSKPKRAADGIHWEKDERGFTVNERECWLNVTCFGKLAENVAESVVKGDILAITGTLQTDEWNDKDTGEKRSSTECTAWTVAVSLAFRTIRHGEGRAERATTPSSDPWATPGVTTPQTSDEPPF